MKRILVIMAVFFLVLMVVSCGVDTGDKFPYEHGGLSWSKTSSYPMTWDDAVTYCEDFGGRLPTISELRTLIKNCPGTETGGECGVTDSCLSEDCWNEACDGCDYDNSGKYSVFGDTNKFWSSLEHSEYTDYAWYVAFYDGYVNRYYEVSYSLKVRCVK